MSNTNMRIDPSQTQKEETYQVILDIIKNSACYNAFLITADVPEIYIQRTLAAIINKYLSRKTSSNVRLRKSRIEILGVMFYKKTVDYAALIWEDF
ncbi:hypothetical protein Tco_1204031 [Tanacetum coccineum]